MYFAVAPQEINKKGLTVRFAVDSSDTSKCILTVVRPDTPDVVATFSRNGYSLSVVEATPPEPEGVAGTEGDPNVYKSDPNAKEPAHG